MQRLCVCLCALLCVCRQCIYRQYTSMLNWIGILKVCDALVNPILSVHSFKYARVWMYEIYILLDWFEDGTVDWKTALLWIVPPNLINLFLYECICMYIWNVSIDHAFMFAYVVHIPVCSCTTICISVCVCVCVCVCVWCVCSTSCRVILKYYTLRNS